MLLYGVSGALVILLVTTGHVVNTGNVVVHLFEWRFDDVTRECEQFLGPRGYSGVQVSPVSEYAVLSGRPWWERYQPFSYRIISRSGNETEFKEMCARCNKAGVKIYVDVCLNDMSSNLPEGTKGTGDSVPDTARKYYPDVPYTAENFHPTCVLNNYSDPINVRNCELAALHDLDQSQEYVRGKMVEFLNKLVDLGASGFRVDAAKHMWPTDLKEIFNRVKNTMTGDRPLVYQEVSSFGSVAGSEYFDIGLVTEFHFGRDLSMYFTGREPLSELGNFGEDSGLMRSDKAFVFIDNHDTQRANSGSILNYKHAKNYSMAAGFMLSWGYGHPRVMSSFNFSNKDQGPPADSDGRIQHAVSEGSCSAGWVCEHRWRPIYSMVKFNDIVQGTTVQNFTHYGYHQISFCRGNKGFVVFNGDNEQDMNARIKTCLPTGVYCDVISGELLNGKCTGKTIDVGMDGTALITIGRNDSQGFLAIHAESKWDQSKQTSAAHAINQIRHYIHMGLLLYLVV